jgi:hypothetical protein
MEIKLSIMSFPYTWINRQSRGNIGNGNTVVHSVQYYELVVTSSLFKVPRWYGGYPRLARLLTANWVATPGYS